MFCFVFISYAKDLTAISWCFIFWYRDIIRYLYSKTAECSGIAMQHGSHVFIIDSWNAYCKSMKWPAWLVKCQQWLDHCQLKCTKLWEQASTWMAKLADSGRQHYKWPSAWGRCSWVVCCDVHACLPPQDWPCIRGFHAWSNDVAFRLLLSIICRTYDVYDCARNASLLLRMLSEPAYSTAYARIRPWCHEQLCDWCKLQDDHTRVRSKRPPTKLCQRWRQW